MNPVRKKRLIIVLTIVVGVGTAVGLALSTLQQSISLFYTPTRIANDGTPTGTRIRAGNLVEKGSLQHSKDSLGVRFVVTDGAKEATIACHGILPNLFREERGIIALDKLGGDDVLVADEVLTKYDEDYMPPEVTKAFKDSGQLKYYENGKATGETSYNQESE